MRNGPASLIFSLLPLFTEDLAEIRQREIVNAILYLLRSACAWRLLPHDLAPWKTVDHYFRLWHKNGLWERMHTALREQVRQKMGRDAEPSCRHH